MRIASALEYGAVGAFGASLFVTLPFAVVVAGAAFAAVQTREAVQAYRRDPQGTHHRFPVRALSRAHAASRRLMYGSRRAA